MGDQLAPSNEPSNFSIDAPFWPDQPMVWLKVNQEELAEKLVAVLEKTELEEISDILQNPPEMKYDAIKARLVSVREKRLGRDNGWLLELLTEMKLDDQNPSCLLRRMRNIVTYAAADVPATTLRSMWMKKLTSEMQTAIVIMESLNSEHTLDDLAKVADKLINLATFKKQVSYLKEHFKPSQMLVNTQTSIIFYDTPSAFAFHTMMKVLPSSTRITIAIWTTMNREVTDKDLVDLDIKTRKYEELRSTDKYPNIKSIYAIHSFIRTQMTMSSELTPLHVWMSYLPPNVRTAIAIRQTLDSNCTLQELAQLADKMVELVEPKK